MDIASYVKLMIDHGANLEAADSKQKMTILLNALYWNSHNVITILLAHGAKIDVTDAQGATLLHYIARFSDLESLQILADSELAYIDVNIVDITGRTAIDIFNSEDTRYRPEEGIERERAVELFTIILETPQGGKRIELLSLR